MSKNKQLARGIRHRRVRRKVSGTAERPRLSVFRSMRSIYAQLIDDDKSRIVLAVSSLSPELKKKYGGNVQSARHVGNLLAEKCREKEIKQVVFDRGGYLYHGRVKALAEGAREGGLEF